MDRAQRGTERRNTKRKRLEEWGERKKRRSANEDDCKACVQRGRRASKERRRRANTGSIASGAFNLIRLISMHLHLSHKSCLPLKVITCTDGGDAAQPKLQLAPLAKRLLLPNLRPAASSQMTADIGPHYKVKDDVISRNKHGYCGLMVAKTTGPVEPSVLRKRAGVKRISAPRIVSRIQGRVPRLSSLQPQLPWPRLTPDTAVYLN